MENGFEEFAASELPRLLALARALTANSHDAWDLTQEALVRVGVRWSRLASQNPGGYARTVLVRLNIDRIRRLRRELLGPAVPDADAPVQLSGELDDSLQQALATLTPKQRAAVVLRTVEDLDHATIAELMGCSVPTARSHLSRGLDRMRIALADTPEHQEARP
ncbi:sigma-70 family RNA polymerase sigma factor [Nocardioides sp. Bht2]|uniref:sigma-70 family RNA polymerase sigma factor n=1 Tax=Nocardioides sp. Bht2 TaxID=3392297 RepID=UPI0039B4BB95